MIRYIGGVLVAVILAAGTAVSAAADRGAVGAVYTATNGAAGNQVLAYDRSADGALAFAGAFDTGGSGTGAGLGNQGGLRMTDDSKFLLVVNAGSNDVSVLRVTLQGLEVTDRIGSGGLRPVSIAVSGRLVYVLNAGGSAGDVDNISGFRISRDGRLTPIAGSTRPLSDTSTAPAQIEFSPDGSLLVVTEKGPNTIGVYPVSATGLLGAGAFYASSGMTPFGFSFGKRSQLFVSEAWGGAPNASTVSSYDVSDSGSLLSIDPVVPNTKRQPAGSPSPTAVVICTSRTPAAAPSAGTRFDRTARSSCSMPTARPLPPVPALPRSTWPSRSTTSTSTRSAPARIRSRFCERCRMASCSQRDWWAGCLPGRMVWSHDEAGRALAHRGRVPRHVSLVA
jgi:6-phosphogluconolactonase